MEEKWTNAIDSEIDRERTARREQDGAAPFIGALVCIAVAVVAVIGGFHFLLSHSGWMGAIILVAALLVACATLLLLEGATGYDGEGGYG